MSYTPRIVNAVWLLAREYLRIQRKYQDPKGPIILGRKFALGSKFSYMFASEVLNNPKNTILVDFPITIARRQQPLYPDILVVQNGELLATLETKIDLGYIRLESYGIFHLKSENKYVYRQDKNGFKQNYRQFFKSDSFAYRIGKERLKVQISQEIKRICVVVTKNNAHGRVDCFETSMKDARFTPVFLLSEKLHPNHPSIEKRKIQSEVTLQKNSIERIFSGL